MTFIISLSLELCESVGRHISHAQSIHYERCLICQLLKMRIRRPCTFRKTKVSTDGTPVFACPLPFQTNLIKTVTSRFVCHALFERLTCQGAKCQDSVTFCFFDSNLIRINASRFGGRAVSEKPTCRRSK